MQMHEPMMNDRYMSDVFQTELDFLGAESSPAFVRTPEGNGSAERGDTSHSTVSGLSG
jgi:hypothetical protein